MFGKNPIRSIERNPNQLFVESIFYTIQGEGPFSGMPALFIRMAGCNLACHFCDTQFEEGMNKRPFETEQLVRQIKEQYDLIQRHLIVITGGEPLRQNIVPLIKQLIDDGAGNIQIETAGTCWQDNLTSGIVAGKVTLVCSPKTPKVHTVVADLCSDWKYIITAGETSAGDGLPNKGTQIGTKDQLQTIYRSHKTFDRIWVSPCDLYDADKNLANLEEVKRVALKYGYRVSLQIHKLLGVE